MTMSVAEPRSEYRLMSDSGLSFQIHSNGTLGRMEYRDMTLNLFPGNAMEAGPANLYLRRLGESPEVTALLGPESPSEFTTGDGCLLARGRWGDVRYTVCLSLAEEAPAWFWRVLLENTGSESLDLDLIHTQDLALAAYGAIRLNEYYVSQYLDHCPLEHPQQGWVVATRQNQPMNGQHPWCLIGSLGQGVAYATDALQVYGYSRCQGRLPEGLLRGLPGQRLQHEHAMTGIQDARLTLAPGQRVERGFFGWLESHHPAATTPNDLSLVDQVVSLSARRREFPGFSEPSWRAAPTLFSTQASLPAEALSEAEIEELWGPERQFEERDGAGLLSFFQTPRTHVVLNAKEQSILRPHGHILRTGGGFLPDESGLTSTVWMNGVFHSMVTQGHVSINRFLSTTHAYLNLFQSHGQRIFVEVAGRWWRLGEPSAFVMQPEGCRWLYRHSGGLIEIRSEAATDRHELTLEIQVREGAAIRCLVTHHVALNGDDGAEAHSVMHEPRASGVFVRARPESDVGRRFPTGGFLIQPLPGTTVERVGGDECLFEDGLSRGQPFLCLTLASGTCLGLRITGQLLTAPEPRAQGADDYWREAVAGMAVDSSAPMAPRRLAAMLPWFAHNALIHFLAPRGLEQYSGGGWGTRDVTQGPVEYLLAIGRHELVRDLLQRVFCQQNPDGDWPQWFMFFERERNIRPGDSHGDIVFWPLLALGQYLLASGDSGLLKEDVPFFHGDPGQAETASLWRHVERALELIHQRVIPGTRLAAYGHGDWNDSLQPADPGLRERLCSAWTVTLHYQSLMTLAQALGELGQAEEAGALEELAARVLADFRRVLLVDGVVCGYAHFEADGRIDYLLHPLDRRTHLSYSLLPMIHSIINDMLDPEEARRHLELIRRHLHGPDGAHLFNQPMIYRGGPMTAFQRAESSSFFGREIGNMYTHAHLRYAEALWRVGDAEAFLAAIEKAIPIDIQAYVPSAARRQANCYYSSSDAAFRDRYQAQEDYALALEGKIPLEGGWRVYSSGAGIATGLILRCLLGIRRFHASLVIDPVMPIALDGLRVELELLQRRFAIRYRIAGKGRGPVGIRLNGASLAFARLENPYRPGGAELHLSTLEQHLTADINELIVSLQ